MKSNKSIQLEKQHKRSAIVVGSGFGGLSVAIRLQSSGFQVTLLEKRDQPGGRAYVYKDKGFTFDAGPTVITAPHCLEELFELSGRKMSDYVELLPVSPFYRLCWEDGYKFDYSSSLEETCSQIRDKNPRDEQGYRRFLDYSKEVFQEGYVKLVDQAFLNLWSMVRVSPKLAQLRAYRSVYRTVASYVKDEQLRQAFSFHSLLVGGNPFTTSSIYTLIHYLERKWGVTFPKGGTGALVQGLVRLFQELGGELQLNSEVEQILTEKGKVKGVQLKSGRSIFADCVVSNADVVHTYNHLLKAEPIVHSTQKKLLKSKFSMSLFLIYFGTNRTYPEVAHHSVLFGKRYKKLLAEIFSGKNKLPEDFSLYLHAPTRTDSSMAPRGCESFYVLSPVPHLGNLDIDWSVEGPRYANRILEYLEKYYLPDVRKHIVTQRIFTPDDFKNELNSHLGAAFSLEPVLTQSAYFRAHNRDSKLKGLYFVGAGTHPGAGVPGVVNSGKATAKVMQHDFAG